MAQTLPCSNSVVHHAHSRMQRRPAPPASGSALLHTPAKPLRTSSAKKLAKAQGAARLRQCTLIRAGQAIADPPSTSSQRAAVDEGALLDCVVVGGGISGLVTAQVTACFPQKHLLRVSVRNMVLRSFKRLQGVTTSFATSRATCAFCIPKHRLHSKLCHVARQRPRRRRGRPYDCYGGPRLSGRKLSFVDCSFSYT